MTGPTEDASDLAIHGARIWTGTGIRDSTSIGMRGGRIVAVGSVEDVRAHATSRTQTIDAQGSFVMPSFIDSHTHFHRAALFKSLFIDFDDPTVDRISRVVEVVSDRVRDAAPGSWIQGDNLRDYRLTERRWPTRTDLDPIGDGHPVVLRSLGKHLVIANSIALRAAGIDRDTPDPAGGRIERDQDGEPTGVLHETAKLRLDSARLDSVVPPIAEADRLRALEIGIAELQRHGISTIHEIVTRPDEIADYLVLREQGRLGIRVRMYVRAIEAQTSLAQLTGLGLRSGFGDDAVRLAGIKISVDGSCESRNAALFEPYPGDPSNLGLVRIPQSELDELFRVADRTGLQIAVHAIGPRAADMALTSFERVLDGRPNDRRHRLEHMYLPGPWTHFERVKRLGLLLSEQPALIHASGDAWIDIFGLERLDRAMPLRAALDLGLRIIANSDYPTTPIDPWTGVGGAVSRTTRDGEIIDATQAISIDEVLPMMTASGAWATFEEAATGTLEPGKWADVQVLNADPHDLPASDLGQVRSTLAFVGGALVHSDGTLAAPTA